MTRSWVALWETCRKRPQQANHWYPKNSSECTWCFPSWFEINKPFRQLVIATRRLDFVFDGLWQEGIDIQQALFYIEAAIDAPETRVITKRGQALRFQFRIPTATAPTVRKFDLTWVRVLVLIHKNSELSSHTHVQSKFQTLYREGSSNIKTDSINSRYPTWVNQLKPQTTVRASKSNNTQSHIVARTV